MLPTLLFDMPTGHAPLDLPGPIAHLQALAETFRRYAADWSHLKYEEMGGDLIHHTGFPPQLTGEASIALLFRHLSASRLVTIAQIEGRVRGAGSEFVLACDMRFAARGSAILGQPEPGLGVIPGRGGELV
jgi:enoyl-CoA hydratase/carnithine racemase